MRKRYALFLLILALGCDPIEKSVFKAVIEAQPEVDNSLDNNLTILGMANDGTDYFLATATSLMTRNMTTDVDWTNVAKPTDTDLCTAFVYAAPDIYAGFKLTNNTYGLYKGTFGITPGWTPVTDPDVAGKQIIGLWNPGGTLYALVLSGTTFTLYYLNGTDFTAAGIAESYPVTGMCYDGADYWAITRDKVFSSTGGAGNFLAIATVPSRESGDAYTGIFYSATYSRYYLTLNNGYVYSTLAPNTSWPVNSGVQTLNSANVYFTAMAEINGNILIGTIQNGFYETRNGDISQITHYEDESVSDLGYSSVLGFYIPAGRDLAFILTGGNGLYRLGFTVAGGWSDLVHE